MTSLHELRAIEEQRIADERAAAAKAKQADDTARRVAEQARLDGIAAREREQRDAQLRIEQARADAEREARMRVEAAEAAERTRLAAALEQQRFAQEIELRRADIAKRRPKWMLVVTAFAVAGGIAFGALAVDRMHEADTAQAGKAAADAEKASAKQEAAAAVGRVDAMQKDLDDLDQKVREAQHAVAVARNKIDLEQAQRALAETNRKVAEAHARQVDIQKAKDKVNRDKPVDVTRCAGQVLCK